MYARMRGQYLVEIPGGSFLCNDRTNAHVTRDKRGKRPSRIRHSLLPYVCDPALRSGAFHLFGQMETEALRVIENLDHCVCDDLRSGQRTANHHARSPAGVDTDSERIHIGVLLENTSAIQICSASQASEPGDHRRVKL